MFAFIRWLWGVYPIALSKPDVVVAIDYGLTKSHILADASLATLEEAAILVDNYRVRAVYTASSHCFVGSDGVEAMLKASFVGRQHLSRVCSYAGPITNSVVEAQVVHAHLEQEGVDARQILLAADALHARSLLYIWSRVFPKATISIVSVNTPAYQSDHVFHLQRGKWRWLLANVARQVYLVCFGLDAASRIRHRPT